MGRARDRTCRVESLERVRLGTEGTVVGSRLGRLGAREKVRRGQGKGRDDRGRSFKTCFLIVKRKTEQVKVLLKVSVKVI